MQIPPNPPAQCPVCGDTDLLSTNRQTVADSSESVEAIHGPLSYKCGKGHVFMAGPSGQSSST